MKELKLTDAQHEKIKHLIEEDETLKEGFEGMIGESLFIRTVTYHLVGKVEKLFAGRFIKLKDASWVADSGRFMNAIKEGSLSEVEPVGDVFVSIGSITDFFPWKHQLPTEQK